MALAGIRYKNLRIIVTYSSPLQHPYTLCQPWLQGARVAGAKFGRATTTLVENQRAKKQLPKNLVVLENNNELLTQLSEQHPICPLSPLLEKAAPGYCPWEALGVPGSADESDGSPSVVSSLDRDELEASYTPDSSTRGRSGQWPSLVCVACGLVAGFYGASRSCRGSPSARAVPGGGHGSRTDSGCGAAGVRPALAGSHTIAP